MKRFKFKMNEKVFPTVLICLNLCARDIKVMRPGPKVQECLNSWLEKYKDDVINALKGAA